MLDMPQAIPLGADWITMFPRIGNVQPTYSPVKEVAYLAGTQAVEWLYAEILPSHIGSGTDTNASIRTHVQALGRPNDDAGHIVGKNQGGPGREIWNIFPQSGNFNRGAYAQNIERMFSQMVGGSGNVRIWWRFIYQSVGEPTRPSSFFYLVEAADGTIVSSDLMNP